jgi:hypothetical protein
MQRKMNFMMWWYFTASTLAVSIAGAANLEYVPDGYFADRKNGEREYDSYLRLQDSAGFRCVLDGKSSYRFKIIGDSITTPLNGMDRFTWYPGSGDVEISGEEKGVAYADRFGMVEAAEYPVQCIEEEAAMQDPTEIGLEKRPTADQHLRTRPLWDMLGRFRRKNE